MNSASDVDGTSKSRDWSIPSRQSNGRFSVDEDGLWRLSRMIGDGASKKSAWHGGGGGGGGGSPCPVRHLKHSITERQVTPVQYRYISTECLSACYSLRINKSKATANTTVAAVVRKKNIGKD
ncbi:hypothetical protein M9435_001839 [Picochlorum sp. BPE23]|nr:hypothetical protein M9435_001839 [Picochlorum sp. BPE23]